MVITVTFVMIMIVFSKEVFCYNSKLIRNCPLILFDTICNYVIISDWSLPDINAMFASNKEKLWSDAKHIMRIFERQNILWLERKTHQKCIKRNFEMKFKNKHQHSTSDNIIFNNKQSSIIEMRWRRNEIVIGFSNNKYCFLSRRCIVWNKIYDHLKMSYNYDLFFKFRITLKYNDYLSIK